MAADSPYTPVVRRLGCLRGIAEVTGFALAVEIGDWTRFTGGSIGSYVGLVPSEHSSGESRSQGSITKTGNAHVRRLLVESAWHHRKPYRARRGFCNAAGTRRPLRRGHAGMPATGGCTTAGSSSPPAETQCHRRRGRGARAGRLVLVVGGDRGLIPHRLDRCGYRSVEAA